jgi:hypothetical protein
MAKIFKALDGMLYMNVTPHAYELWRGKTLDLFVVWEKGATVYKLPILEEVELTYALTQEGKHICIEIGSAEQLSDLLKIKSFKWEKADTITHEGFLYVKYNDLLD